MKKKKNFLIIIWQYEYIYFINYTLRDKAICEEYI